jgi:hypothetical protein
MKAVTTSPTAKAVAKIGTPDRRAVGCCSPLGVALGAPLMGRAKRPSLSRPDCV